MAFDLATEERVLVAVLCHEWARQTAAAVETYDFGDIRTSTIWQAMRNLEAAGDPRLGTLDTLAAVHEHLVAQDARTGRHVADAVSLAHLADMTNRTENYPDVATFRADCQWLRELAILRDTKRQHANGYAVARRA